MNRTFSVKRSADRREKRLLRECKECGDNIGLRPSGAKWCETCSGLRRKEKFRGYRAKYAKSHPGEYNAATVKRNAVKLQATTSWTNNKFMTYFFSMAHDLGLTSDHIYPLISPWVCGLHVPNNMQLMSKSDNSRKGNRRHWSQTENSMVGR